MSIYQTSRVIAMERRRESERARMRERERERERLTVASRAVPFCPAVQAVSVSVSVRSVWHTHRQTDSRKYVSLFAERKKERDSD